MGSNVSRRTILTAATATFGAVAVQDALAPLAGLWAVTYASIACVAVAGALAARAAKMALTKGKSRFAIGPLADFGPVDQSVNWFAIVFIIVMAALVLST